VVSLPLSVRAVAFDLDGTLLDTLPDLAAAARSMLQELGRAQVDDATVRRYIGNGIPRLTKRLLTGTLDGEPTEPEFEHALAVFEQNYKATLSQRTRPFSGVEEGLRRFHSAGIPLACVTNKAQAFTLPLLEATGLAHWFALVVSGDSLPAKKPDPLPLLHCARQFAIEPCELLVIGDSSADVTAARAAGCPVFCVSYGYSREKLQDLSADAIVPDLVQAFGLVKHPQRADD
jgi:phosphoglycolate phosphatase